MAVRIERVRPERFSVLKPRLRAIYMSAYAEPGLMPYSYSKISDVEGYLDWLYSGDPDGFFVAYYAPSERSEFWEPVGFVSVHKEWEHAWQQAAELHELVVSKDYQGRGIGRRLMETAMQYAKAAGKRRLALWVGENNQRAIDWYRRLAFEPAGRWNVWIRMVKELDGSTAEKAEPAR
jgi:ribosomal protein S18 acetylase RimI-like enzyme